MYKTKKRTQVAKSILQKAVWIVLPIGVCCCAIAPPKALPVWHFKQKNKTQVNPASYYAYGEDATPPCACQKTKNKG